jgi:hypothetical protein
MTYMVAERAVRHARLDELDTCLEVLERANLQKVPVVTDTMVRALNSCGPCIPQGTDVAAAMETVYAAQQIYLVPAPIRLARGSRRVSSRTGLPIPIPSLEAVLRRSRSAPRLLPGGHRRVAAWESGPRGLA